MEITGTKSTKRLRNGIVVACIIIPCSAYLLWLTFTAVEWNNPIPRPLLGLIAIASPLSLLHLLYNVVLDYKASKVVTTLEINGDSLYVDGEEWLNRDCSNANVLLIGFSRRSKRFAITLADKPYTERDKPLKDYIFSVSMDEMADLMPKRINVKKQTFFGM